MVVLTCPCCGKNIEIHIGGQGASKCLESDPPIAPTKGPFFDKTLHPPKITQQAHQVERERFKTALGELPIGSATTKDEHRKELKKDQEEAQILTKIITKYPSKLISDGSELPEVEEPTYERDAKGKPTTDVSKIISDYPLEEEDENGE